MTPTATLPVDLAPILALPVEQRMRVIDAIWDSIPDETRDGDLSDELKSELNRRLEEARADPDGGVPWEEVLAAARARSAARWQS